jgi:hypothetical protein
MRLRGEKGEGIGRDQMGKEGRREEEVEGRRS